MISYLLASAVTQPFIATTSDIWGTQTKVLWLSVATLVGGSIICALSQSPVLILAGLTLQGLGSGGMISLVQVISDRLVPSRRRPGGHCIVSASWAIGSVAGPFIGSKLASTATFYRLALFNTPLCGLSLALIPWVVPSCGSSTQCSWLRVDWEGMVLFLSSVSSLVFGITWSGVNFAWTSKFTFLTIAIGSSGIILFIIWERNVAEFPIFQATLFRKASQIAAYFYCCFQGAIVRLFSDEYVKMLIKAIVFLPAIFLAFLLRLCTAANTKTINSLYSALLLFIAARESLVTSHHRLSTTQRDPQGRLDSYHPGLGLPSAPRDRYSTPDTNFSPRHWRPWNWVASECRQLPDNYRPLQLKFGTCYVLVLSKFRNVSGCRGWGKGVSKHYGALSHQIWCLHVNCTRP